MKKFITFVLLNIIIQGCDTLSHTKKTYVHQFAASTKDLPQYALKFNQSLSNVRKSRGVYFANTLSTPFQTKLVSNVIISNTPAAVTVGL